MRIYIFLIGLLLKGSYKPPSCLSEGCLCGPCLSGHFLSAPASYLCSEARCTLKWRIAWLREPSRGSSLEKALLKENLNDFMH